jgi:hypothetical protein
MTPVASVLHKCFVAAANTPGALDKEITEGVDCTFGQRTIKAAEHGGLANAENGNFPSYAQNPDQEMNPVHKEPRNVRFGFRKLLSKELPEGALLCGNQPVRRVHPTILHEVISRR